MLGLTRTSERADLVWTGDRGLRAPDDDGNGHVWRRAMPSEDERATVIRVRALNSREMLRAGLALRAVGEGPAGAESEYLTALADGMAAVCRMAVVEVREGAALAGPEALDWLAPAALIALGSWVLAESGASTDPT